MANPMGKFATGWKTNKFKRLVGAKKMLNVAAINLNSVSKEIGRAIKDEEHGSEELVRALDYAVKIGQISEEVGMELLSDKQKADKFLSTGEV
ncbi:MAG: hypothetical protein WC445_01065 [Patescibacteria group bacterium]